MARAKTITGPYELDPQPAVLTTRDAPEHPLQKAGHGELVETPDGEWFLVHLASRPVDPARRCVLGRETCLQRVRWSDDGWLRLAHGGWHPEISVAPPRGAAAAPPPAPRPRDDFDAPLLDASWSSLRAPIDATWLSLTERPGWLRLRGRESLHSQFAQSLVAKRLPSLAVVAETRLEFAPTHYTQMAGLVCYYDTRTHYYLRVTHDERRGKILGVVLTDDGAYVELGDSACEVGDWPRIFLRATIERAALRFSASPDGKAWRPIGPVLDASKLSDDYGTGLHFTGAFVGLCAQDLDAGHTPADFEYFALEQSG